MQLKKKQKKKLVTKLSSVEKEAKENHDEKEPGIIKLNTEEIKWKKKRKEKKHDKKYASWHTPRIHGYAHTK